LVSSFLLKNIGAPLAHAFGFACGGRFNPASASPHRVRSVGADLGCPRVDRAGIDTAGTHPASTEGKKLIRL
jgi:hypothetical protein